ncbi:MAG TPA: hypothetical protein VEU97_11270 [Ktedonobacteraceae bacterium]|nr:hypothetical protein [Ktedonobacteraceae bacterium]
MKNRARWNLPLRMIGTTCFMFGGFGINFSTIPTWFATLLMVVGISLAIIATYREKRMLPPLRSPLFWIAICCIWVGCIIFAAQGLVPKVIAAIVIAIGTYLWNIANKRSNQLKS